METEYAKFSFWVWYWNVMHNGHSMDMAWEKKMVVGWGKQGQTRTCATELEPSRINWNFCGFLIASKLPTLMMKVLYRGSRCPFVMELTTHAPRPRVREVGAGDAAGFGRVGGLAAAALKLGSQDVSTNWHELQQQQCLCCASLLSTRRGRLGFPSASTSGLELITLKRVDLGNVIPA